MSSNPSGTSPPAAATGDGGDATSRGGQRRKNKNHNSGNRRAESKFEGKCSKIKTSVYDVVSGKDTFAKMTREITEYVGREFDDAREFRTGMVEMRLAALVELAPLEDNTPMNFELWKMARQTFEKQTKARRRNSSRVFALVIGQCSQALRNRMEVNKRWGWINDASDVMALLQLVQQGMIQHQTRQKPTHTLLDAETQVYAFKQQHLVNNEYYEKFKDLVTNAEWLGSDRAKDQFLAVMFLVNSNRARYGSLVRDIENEYTRGSDTYPTTLSAAYDYLMNYRVDKTSNTHDPDESGLSYYTEDESGRGEGCGGRGSGRGTGRGRGNRGGRGTGRGNETRD
jgi:hypothetical protein